MSLRGSLFEKMSFRHIDFGVKIKILCVFNPTDIIMYSVHRLGKIYVQCTVLGFMCELNHNNLCTVYGVHCTVWINVQVQCALNFSDLFTMLL